MPLIMFILTLVVYLPFIVFSSLFHPAFASPQWVIDGDVLNIAKNNETRFAVTPHALAPSLIFHNDTPYISWSEINSKGISIVYVKYKEGREWVEAGGPLNISPNSNSSFPAIASSGNRLYAAWTEEDSNKINQLYVKEWDGSAWKQVGGSLNADPQYSASSPVISADKSFLYAAWTELNPNNISHLFVKQWDGNSWRLIGDKINRDAGRHALTPSLVTGKGGVYLAWSEYDRNGVAQLYVSQWNGSAWDTAVDSRNVDPAGHALSPSMSISGTTPYIAWMEYSHEAVSRIYVKRWDARKGWVKLGDGINMDMRRNATSPSLGMNDGVPYVAWIEAGEAGIPDVYVKHWDGSAWSRDGEFVNNAPQVSESVSAPSIAIKDKIIYLAFGETDDSAIFRLYVKRLAEVKGSTARYEKKPAPASTTVSRKFFTVMPKDVVPPADIPPPLAFKSLQRTPLGEVDWMSGIRQGIFKPFDSTDPEAGPALPPYDLDMVLPVKKEFGIPQVIFPHSSHTMWLDCRNCHPAIFAPKRGANPITMHSLLEGQYCAKCHGVVAFRLYDCFRCHSK